MHDLARPHHPAAERLADRLVAEADADQRRARLRRGGDQREADAGLVGVAGPGREQDRRGAHRHRRLHVDLVVAPHHDLGPELAEIVEEVVGEAVVVVDQQQHFRGLSRGFGAGAGGPARYTWPRRSDRVKGKLGARGGGGRTRGRHAEAAARARLLARSLHRPRARAGPGAGARLRLPAAAAAPARDRPRHPGRAVGPDAARRRRRACGDAAARPPPRHAGGAAPRCPPRRRARRRPPPPPPRRPDRRAPSPRPSPPRRSPPPPRRALPSAGRPPPPRRAPPGPSARRPTPRPPFPPSVRPPRPTSFSATPPARCCRRRSDAGLRPNGSLLE